MKQISHGKALQNNEIFRMKILGFFNDKAVLYIAKAL